MGNSNLFKLFMGIAISAVTAACMDIRAVDKEVGPADGEGAQKFAPEGLFAEVHEREDIGSYEVRIAANDGRLTLRKSSDGESKTIVLIAQGGQAIDADVVSGKRYRYERLEGAGSVPSSAEVEVPLDFWAAEDLVLTAENNPFREGVRYRRLGFGPGVTVTTSGLEVTLEAERMEFDRAILQSWPEHDRASALNARKNGGRIELRAAVAEGDLHLELRGRHGEQGPDQFGERHDPQLKGRPGPRGTDARHEFVHRTFDGSVGLTRMARCVEQAGDGGRGEAGLRGWQGARGGRGGDAASLVVKVMDRSNLRLTVRSRPGEGGRGGLGSLGGEGGEGGAPGERFHPELKKTPIPAVVLHENCREPLAGSRGPQGERGLDGAAGEEGRAGSVCFVNPETQKCEARDGLL